jgi:hypothetical protein
LNILNFFELFWTFMNVLKTSFWLLELFNFFLCAEKPYPIFWLPGSSTNTRNLDHHLCLHTYIILSLSPLALSSVMIFQILYFFTQKTAFICQWWNIAII